MKRIILALIIILTTSCNNKQTTTHIPSEKVQNEESTDTNQQEEYINMPPTFTIGDLTYEVIDSNHVALKRCNTSVSEIDIPTIVIHDGTEYKI